MSLFYIKVFKKHICKIIPILGLKRAFTKSLKNYKTAFF